MLRAMVTPLALLALGVASGCGSGGGETITGTVVMSGSAQGVMVGIRSGGVLHTATAGVDGSFSVSGVTLPYEAMVVSNSSVVVLQGLTVLHPMLPGISEGSPPAHGATLQGSVTPPPGTTFGAFEALNLAFVTAGETNLGTAFLEPPAQAFGMSASWNGPTSVTGNLYVFASHVEFPPAPTQPPASVYDGFVMFPALTISDGQTRVGLDAVLQPVGTQQLSGTVTYPAGFEPDLYPQVSLWVQQGPGLSFPLDSSPANSANFTVSVPELPRISFQVQAWGLSNAGAGYQVRQSAASFDGGPMNVTFPTPPTLDAPAELATVQQASASFQWSPVAGASLYFLQVQGDGLISVYTTQPSATLPDLSTFGLPALGKASWAVWSFATPSGVDQLVGGTGVSVFNLGDQVQTNSALGTVVLQ